MGIYGKLLQSHRQISQASLPNYTHNIQIFNSILYTKKQVEKRKEPNTLSVFALDSVYRHTTIFLTYAHVGAIHSYNQI